MKRTMQKLISIIILIILFIYANYLFADCEDSIIQLEEGIEQLERGADISELDFDRSPICLSIECNRVDLLEYYFEHGFEIPEECLYSYTPLYYAVRNDNIDIVALLIEYGIDINMPEQGPYPFNTSLYCAVGSNSEEMVNFILENGANESNCHYGLYNAVRNGNTELAEILVDHAPIRSRTIQLRQAVEDHNLEMMQLLTDHGAVPSVFHYFNFSFNAEPDINFDDQWSYNYNTLIYNDQGDFTEGYGNWNDDYEYSYNDFSCLIYYFSTIYYIDTELVRQILISGADVNEVDNDGRTALHFAARSDNTEVVEMLLEHGADIDAIDQDGFTELTYSFLSGHEGPLLLLLNSAADPNIKGGYDRTSLHYVARYGTREIIELFMQYGADASIVDSYGNTPLDYAEEYRDQDIVELLQGH